MSGDTFNSRENNGETRSSSIIKDANDSSTEREIHHHGGLVLFSVLSILQNSASTTASLRFIIQEGDNTVVERLSYASLWARTKNDACALQCIRHMQPYPGSTNIFSLYFSTHYENIRWFWAVLAAGGVPCILPPLVNDIRLRKDHIAHLVRLLDSPTILTTRELCSAFEHNSNVNILTIESLMVDNQPTFEPPTSSIEDDLSVLMLTSGSTGNAKAVCLSNEQILRACAGKSAQSKTTHQDIFLNWVGLDHVVNLVEVHIHAMSLCADQVHVQANDLLANPLLFPRLIHQHRITVTFAPNFFLSLVTAQMLEIDPALDNPEKLDLSSLRALFSGGEANSVRTAVEFTKAFQAYGAPAEFLCPGYGLTESCAGIIWAFNCPSYGSELTDEFTSVGSPIPGCCIRILDSEGSPVNPGEIGDLQISGPVVFKQYYNNVTATKNAFTPDGWFITGDQARIDLDNQLHIIGRLNDMVNINGVKYSCSEIETTIEQSNLPGVSPSLTIVFPHRPQGASTEEYCIVYKATEDNITGESRANTYDTMTRVSSAITNRKPFSIIPLPDDAFNKCSLGKVLRARLRKAFEAGESREMEENNRLLIHAFKDINRVAPANPTEHLALDVACEMLGLRIEEASVTSNIFHLGFTSLDIISFILRLQSSLELSNAITLTDVLRKPTIRSICDAVDDNKDPNESYDPVVLLQPFGNKAPLWIIHPASGNVLDFIPLSRYLNDRPLYGIRASGVRPGERFARDILEMASTYFNAIKRVQPKGPYAVSGYSLGSSIAFEVAKMLIANGDEVRFLAVLDSPPHISELVGNLTWSAGLVMVSFFLGLIPEKYSNEMIPRLRNEPADVCLDFILSNADVARLDALQLDREGLSQFADTVHNFGNAARNYKPIGTVPNMDALWWILCSASQQVGARIGPTDF
ncbi:acetyl-CoA synthetase-like protein [Whalleya microplaca]|nr:acetyl-CoA synthetase-like protein [Whalleya microplaca]